jgi:hypothetical protein
MTWWAGRAGARLIYLLGNRKFPSRTIRDRVSFNLHPGITNVAILFQQRLGKSIAGGIFTVDTKVESAGKKQGELPNGGMRQKTIWQRYRHKLQRQSQVHTETRHLLKNIESNSAAHVWIPDVQTGKQFAGTSHQREEHIPATRSESIARDRTVWYRQEESGYGPFFRHRQPSTFFETKPAVYTRIPSQGTTAGSRLVGLRPLKKDGLSAEGEVSKGIVSGADVPPGNSHLPTTGFAQNKEFHQQQPKLVSTSPIGGEKKVTTRINSEAGSLSHSNRILRLPKSPALPTPNQTGIAPASKEIPKTEVQPAAIPSSAKATETYRNRIISDDRAGTGGSLGKPSTTHSTTYSEKTISQRQLSFHQRSLVLQNRVVLGAYHRNSRNIGLSKLEPAPWRAGIKKRRERLTGESGAAGATSPNSAAAPMETFFKSREAAGTHSPTGEAAAGHPEYHPRQTSLKEPGLVHLRRAIKAKPENTSGQAQKAEKDSALPETAHTNFSNNHRNGKLQATGSSPVSRQQLQTISQEVYELIVDRVRKEKERNGR